MTLRTELWIGNYRDHKFKIKKKNCNMHYKPFFNTKKFFLDKQLESYIVQYGNIIFIFFFLSSKPTILYDNFVWQFVECNMFGYCYFVTSVEVDSIHLTKHCIFITLSNYMFIYREKALLFF